MLKRLLNLIRREKVYALLALLVIASYSFALYRDRTMPPDDQDKASMQKYEETQESFEARFKDKKTAEETLRQKPRVAALFQLLTFLTMGGMLAGSLFGFRLLGSPKLREQIKNREFRDWGGWSLEMFFKTVILFMAIALVLSFGFGGLKKAVMPDAPDHLLVLAHTLLSNLICVWLMMTRVLDAGGKPGDLGLRVPQSGWLKEMGTGVAAYWVILPVFMIVISVVLSIASELMVQPEPHRLAYMFLDEKSGNSLIYFSLFMAIVAAPVTEEIFFRGFCYSVFKNRFGAGAGMIVSASVFALIHGNVFAFWPVFVLGLALAWLYETRKSLIAPIVVHMTHNAVFIAYFFLAKNMIQ